MSVTAYDLIQTLPQGGDKLRALKYCEVYYIYFIYHMGHIIWYELFASDYIDDNEQNYHEFLQEHDLSKKQKISSEVC